MKIEDIAEVVELLKLMRHAPPEVRNQIFMIIQGAVIASNQPT